MLDASQQLLLAHIFVLGVPMVVVSVFLLYVTLSIRRFLEKHAVQMTLFRGILLVGYLFVFIAAMHLIEEILEWYGYGIAELEVSGLWHGAMLVVLMIVSYSFYHYRKMLRQSEG